MISLILEDSGFCEDPEFPSGLMTKISIERKICAWLATQTLQKKTFFSPFVLPLRLGII